MTDWYWDLASFTGPGIGICRLVYGALSSVGSSLRSKPFGALEFIGLRVNPKP